MIKKLESLVCRFHKEQHGQMLIMSAIALMLLLAVASLAVDFAQVYLGYHQLKMSTDAAAMAGAENLSTLSPTYATVQNTALLYSSVNTTGNTNIFNNLRNVAMASGYPLPECLTTLANAPWGIACVSLSGAPKGSGGTANAVQVKQQATIPLSFAGLFGMGSVTVTATSTAAMRGGLPPPYNMAIILDTTASMGSTEDGGTNCANPYTKISCALMGVQTLMVQLAPCQGGVYNCTSNPVDQIAMYTYPPVQASTDAAEYCGGGTIKTVHYYKNAADGTVLPNGSKLPDGTTPPAASYQIVPAPGTGSFLYDYLSAANTLNPTSDLVLATNTNSKSGSPNCITTPGGSGTYFAGVIYNAQAALAAAQLARPVSTNVMIILSDGDANSQSSEMIPEICDSKGKNCTYDSGGVYFSPQNECQQAVTAAKAATAAGTTVFSIAYGSSTSGCSTDTSGITPCSTMSNMASTAQQFYTDATSGKGGCTSGQSVTKLSDIFTSITNQLNTAKLIPNRTT
jgi:hypothetical protein